MNLFYDISLCFFVVWKRQSPFVVVAWKKHSRNVFKISSFVLHDKNESHTGNNIKATEFSFLGELRLLVLSFFAVVILISFCIWQLSKFFLLAFLSLFFSLHPCNFNGRTEQLLSPSFVSAVMIAPGIELGCVRVYLSIHYHFHPEREISPDHSSGYACHQHSLPQTLLRRGLFPTPINNWDYLDCLHLGLYVV